MLGGGDESDKNETYGIRPVVDLKDGVRVLRGLGTSDDPYKIKGIRY